MSSQQAYRETLKAFRQQLSEAEHRVQELRRAIVFIEELLEREPTVRLVGQSERLPSGLPGLSLPDAAQAILRQGGKALPAAEIAKRMLEDGYPYSGNWKKLKMSLVGSLDRKVKSGETFQKPAPGVYALKESKPAVAS